MITVLPLPFTGFILCAQGKYIEHVKTKKSLLEKAVILNENSCVFNSPT